MWWSISVPIVATYCPYFDLSRLWFPEMGGKRNASTTVASEGLFEPFIDSGADSSFVVEISLSLVSGLSVFILLFCNTQNILASILNRNYFPHKQKIPGFKQFPYFISPNQPLPKYSLVVTDSTMKCNRTLPIYILKQLHIFSKTYFLQLKTQTLTLGWHNSNMINNKLWHRYSQWYL